jgi:hypothetical protein
MTGKNLYEATWLRGQIILFTAYLSLNRANKNTIKYEPMGRETRNNRKIKK